MKNKYIDYKEISRVLNFDISQKSNPDFLNDEFLELDEIMFNWLEKCHKKIKNTDCSKNGLYFFLEANAKEITGYNNRIRFSDFIKKIPVGLKKDFSDRELKVIIIDLYEIMGYYIIPAISIIDGKQIRFIYLNKKK